MEMVKNTAKGWYGYNMGDSESQDAWETDEASGGFSKRR